VLTDSGVPTRTLYESFKAEGRDRPALAMVARTFEVPAKDVEAAVRFEEELLAA
jgi:hypothetical protein